MILSCSTFLSRVSLDANSFLRLTFVRILLLKIEVPSIRTSSLFRHIVFGDPPNLGLTFSYAISFGCLPFHSFRASYCLLISFASAIVSTKTIPHCPHESYTKSSVQVGIWVITGRRNNFHSKRGAAREKEKETRDRRNE